MPAIVEPAVPGPAMNAVVLHLPSRLRPTPNDTEVGNPCCDRMSGRLSVGDAKTGSPVILTESPVNSFSPAVDQTRPTPVMAGSNPPPSPIS